MKKIVKIILVVLLTLLPCLCMAVGAFAFPVYDGSYYAGLSVQQERLKEVNTPKVVLVGGSSVAFGTDCELFESLYGKPLVDVGLYGVFGTKMMLQLSKCNLNRGDTVVIAPELSAKSYSLEQTFTALWKAAESNVSLLTVPAFSDADKVLGSLLPYLQEKREYLLSGEKPTGEGVYSLQSLNAYGEIAKGLRLGNAMRAGYNGESILHDKEDIDEDFISYVNNYVCECKSKGVTVYFSFSPLNQKAVQKQNISEDDLYSLYDYLRSNLQCEVISDPNDTVYDYRYFYDTNFHLNDSGAKVHTVQLVRALKGVTGDNSALNVTLPTPPEPIQKIVEIDESLNYTSAELFEYEEEDGMLVVVGVKDEAKKLKTVVLPVVYQDKYIYNVAAGAFSGCRWERVEVPVGYTELSGGAFNGCSSLKEICLYETSGANISVYDDTFNGVDPSCKILLLKASKIDFLSGDGMYMWQRVTLPIEEARA